MMDALGRWDEAVALVGWVSWKVAVLALGVLGAALLVRFLQKKPCWAWPHDWKYLAVALRIWHPTGNCGRLEHPIHTRNGRLSNAWVSVAVCRKCPTHKTSCLGDYWLGAWKIENERLVPDEKALANFEPNDTIRKQESGK